MIIPIASETYIRRFPLVTTLLIALNVLIFLATRPIMTRQAKEFNSLNYELWKIEYTIYIRHTDEFPEIAEKGEDPRANMELIHKKIENGEIHLDDYEYEKWSEVNEKLKELKENLFVRKWGFIPDKFNFVSLITSLFLHGGLLHLIGNMWFLWLVGVNIEDIWGRPFFLAFYIVSGIVASVFHAVMNYSDIPLIGASGAIAGLMGAFALRFFNLKIKLLIFFIPLLIHIDVYAGVMLPFWFLEQLISAMYLTHSGVAFWAHVAGFGFGVLVVFLMRITGFEKKVIEKRVEETIDFVDRDLREAYQSLEKGEDDIAIERFLKFLKKYPDNPEANLELAGLYLKKGNSALAAKYYRKLLKEGIQKGEPIPIIQAYNDYIKENKLERFLLPGEFFRVADAYKKNNDGHGEIAVLLQAYKFYRDGKDAPIILLRLIKALRENYMMEKAKRVFEELIKRFPQYREQAKIYLEGGEY